MSDGRTLLVLGARGFVGRHLCTAAEEAGLRVIRASRRGSGADVAADLLDPGSLRALIDRTAPDAVANAAGIASVAASWEDPGRSIAVNAGGAENLLEAVGSAAPGTHVLCISSAQVYGEPAPGRLPFREEQRLDPVSPYGRAKAQMEAACARAAERTPVAVVRAFNLLGPGQDDEHAPSGFARDVAAAEAAGEAEAEVRIGNPGAARDFLDVRDGATALVAVIERRLTGTYNLCSGRATALSELIELLGEASSLPVRAREDPVLHRPADPATSYGDPGRLRAAGWEPRIPLRRSIADLLDWWRARLSPDRQPGGEARPR